MVQGFIQTIFVLALCFFCWQFFQTYKNSQKEKQKDEAQLKKISQKYSGADISDPVNDLVKRIRNK